MHIVLGMNVTQWLILNCLASMVQEQVSSK